jgi:hypothetical protein
MAKLNIEGTSVAVISGSADDYIFLTDIARHKDSIPSNSTGLTTRPPSSKWQPLSADASGRRQEGKRT